MSCHYCNSKCTCCIPLSDSAPTGGTRYIGDEVSSPTFINAAIPVCAGDRFWNLTVAVTQVSGPTGATGTFTLVKGGLSACTETLAPQRMPLKVQIPLIEGRTGCASVTQPIRIYPIEKVAVLVESSNPNVTFLTEALLC
jgi:hypothetical protein